MKNSILFGTALLALAACGDDNKDNPKIDAPSDKIDAPDVDAAPSFPAAPTIGTQLDRLGRPTINTALNRAFAPQDATNATLTLQSKDAYNAAAVPSMWATTILPNGDNVIVEFQRNLAIIDALDKVCGNQAVYQGGEPGHDNPTAYAPMATLLADDQLYVDTSKSSCLFYLSLEADVALNFPHSQCGGRAPTNDIVDSSYSLLAVGPTGFDYTVAPPKPLTIDNVNAHTDVSDSVFPFLGAPHQ